MKIARTILLSLSFFTLTLAVYIGIGSIDTGKKPAIPEIAPIDDANNGFQKIAFLNSEEPILSNEQRDEVKLQLTASSWDPAFGELINKNQHIIDHYIDAAEHPYFQLPLNPDPFHLPNYTNLIDVGRLVLLKSRAAADANGMDEAIRLAEKALKAATLVKSEKNQYLISFMIGVVMQNETLIWINQLSQQYPLSLENQLQLLNALKNVPSFDADGFRQVFNGEYRFSRAATDELLSTPLAERWQTYQKDEDYWNMDLDSDFEFGRENLKEELYGFLSTLFPRFYMHRNTYLSEIASKLESLSEHAQQYCNGVPPESPSKSFSGFTWTMLIQPNSGSEIWTQSYDPKFYEYFIRRCFSQTQVNATKALIALRSYHLDHQRYPNELNDLVPEYLEELPLDPFDGSAMRYSSRNQWIYSVGANFSDDGGSASACFKHQCARETNCSENPTFPLNTSICITEAED